MMMGMTQRGQVRVNLTAESKAGVDRVCDRYGMAHQEVASRVYSWFAAQEEIVQASILGVLPETLEGHAADIYMEQVKARRAEHRTPRGKGKREPK